MKREENPGIEVKHRLTILILIPCIYNVGPYERQPKNRKKEGSIKKN